jgi:hypothetical protein
VASAMSRYGDLRDSRRSPHDYGDSREFSKSQDDVCAKNYWRDPRVLPQCNAWLIHKPIHLLTGSSIGGCSRPLALSSLTRTAAVWAYGSASGRDRSPRNDTMGRSGHWRRAEGYRIIRPRQISGVEDGRGGCAPRRPFPVPAHQTGRADFQHPAFRPASSYDPRRASIVRAHKLQNRKFSKHITKENRAAPRLLTLCRLQRKFCTRS